MKTLSVIIPCFNEEAVIETTYLELTKVLISLKRNYEIIFVNDGSNDDTFNIIKNLSEKDKNITGISLSRNFGKEGVIEAGLKSAKGDLIALMDADLQDPPYLLSEMISKIENEGYDQVGTYRTSRKSQSLFTKLYSETYYRIFNILSNDKVMNNEREYRLFTKQVAQTILSLKENRRYIKNIWSWVGFKTTYIGYEDIDRAAGVTKYNIPKKLKLAKHNILVSTNQPLKLVSLFTSLYVIILFIFSIYLLIEKNFEQSISALVYFWLFAFVFIFLSIIAEYMALLFIEIKGRPNYIIKEYFESDLKNNE